MIGAGVFSALGPAAQSAGSGLLVGLLIAAFVAYCNATSSAQLAAVYPESGGTYIYGRERLGRFWGYLAGWAFVVGKVASCSAIALTFGYYADADLARPLAISAVAALAAVNYFGVEKTARLTRAIVTVVIASLALVIAAILIGGNADAGHLTPLFDGDHGLTGVLQSAGLLFFAFAGYARIATLGEEVADPRKTIPQAIPIALGITLVIYSAVAVSALMAVGADALAQSDAPLATAVRAGTLDEAAPVVRIGATVASLGVLLSLMAGVSRTLFAMAANRDMPSLLASVHPRYKVPDRAELAVAAVVVLVVAFADLRGAIGFSSFGVLLYYAIANASAFTLPREQRRWPQWLSITGIIGCLLLAFTLPLASVLAGGAVILAGCVTFGAARVYDRLFSV
jgi:APA family basic amino acid/polyamine antiporter